MRQIKIALLSGTRDETGFILPLALIALVVLAALSGALLAVGSTEVPIAANHLRAIQAQYLAEAGLEDAFDAFRVNPTTVATAPTLLTAVPNLNGASPTLAAFGSYTVKYQKTGGNTIRVISTGLNADGIATKVLTAVFTNDFGGSGGPGILTGGDFTINGNPTITGTCGNIFVNGNLSVSNPTVAGNVLATGTYTVTGTPVIGGTSGGGQPARTVPNVVPSDFLIAAKASLPASEVFQMKSDGRVLDGNNNLLTTLTSGATYRYFTYTSGSTASWSQTGNTGSDGAYYFEGNVSIAGSPGSNLSPWKASILATGYIDVAGTPVMQTHLTDTLLVAGTDVWVHGNVSLTINLPGLVAAHEQVNIQGSVSMSGYIVAQGAGSSSGLVVSDGLGGNTTITSNCGSISPPLADQLRILSWGR